VNIPKFNTEYCKTEVNGSYSANSGLDYDISPIQIIKFSNFKSQVLVKTQI